MAGLSRDEMLVQNVQDMKELGMFTQEFSIAGCAFWGKDTVMYAISVSSDKLYRWKYQTENVGRKITAVHQLSHRTLVPAGTKEPLIRALKLAMLRLLSENYPEAYFTTDAQKADKAADDRDEKALTAIRYQLEGTGGKEELALYQALVSRSYLQKHLLEQTYIKLSRWIQLTLADLDNDLENRDTSSKVFYSLAYQDEGGSWRIIADGSASKIYCLLEEKRQAGFRTSPVIAKTFFFSHPDTVADARQRSRDYFTTLFDQTYQQMLRQMVDVE